MRRSRRNTVAEDRAAMACSMTRELMAIWYSSAEHHSPDNQTVSQGVTLDPLLFWFLDDGSALRRRLSTMASR